MTGDQRDYKYKYPGSPDEWLETCYLMLPRIEIDLALISLMRRFDVREAEKAPCPKFCVVTSRCGRMEGQPGRLGRLGRLRG